MIFVFYILYLKFTAEFDIQIVGIFGFFFPTQLIQLT